MTRSALYLICVLALCGCQSAAPVSAPSTPPAVLKPGQLSPQNLARGDCAIFVWERAAPNRFILFTQSRTRSGLWYDGNIALPVTLDEESGEAEQGQSPQQKLSGADVALDLRLLEAQVITDGTRYSGGRLRVEQGEDWEKFVPVVGLSSCNLTP